MKVVVAGGSGFLGRALGAHLTSLDCDVVVLTRDASGQAPRGGIRQVQWDPDGGTGGWALEIEGSDVVVNLTGASIADRRWSLARKALLRSSRVLPTRSLVAAIRRATARPPVFIQASGAGFYGTSASDQELDESFSPGDDFLGDLCVSWEAEAHPVSALGCRLVILRNGVVLGEGGIVEKMRRPFQFFVGGPVATGQQYLSWIHISDWTRLAVFAISTPSATGVLNATAPNPVTNAVFSAALAKALHRPSWMPVPAFALRVMYGEMADALLVNGQRIVPKHATDLGFTFEHPAIEEAMADVIARRNT